MTAPHRSRNLGDLGDNAPGALGLGRPAHAEGRRDAPPLRRGRGGPGRSGAGACTGLRVLAQARHVESRRTRAVRLSRRHLPAVDRGPREEGTAGDHAPLRRVRARLSERVRPLHGQAAARRPPGSRRNGSYLVFRQLRQDVRGFWSFLDQATKRPDGSSDPDRRLRLAAKMVGRWPSGAPLALSPDDDDPLLANANDFAYHRYDRTARAARSARTSGARTRATRSIRSRGPRSRGRSTVATGSCAAAASTDRE